MIEEVGNSFLNLPDTIVSAKVPILSHKDFADLLLLASVDRVINGELIASIMSASLYVTVLAKSGNKCLC